MRKKSKSGIVFPEPEFRVIDREIGYDAIRSWAVDALVDYPDDVEKLRECLYDIFDICNQVQNQKTRVFDDGFWIRKPVRLPKPETGVQ